MASVFHPACQRLCLIRQNLPPVPGPTWTLFPTPGCIHSEQNLFKCSVRCGFWTSKPTIPEGHVWPWPQLQPARKSWSLGEVIVSLGPPAHEGTEGEMAPAHVGMDHVNQLAREP